MLVAGQVGNERQEREMFFTFGQVQFLPHEHIKIFEEKKCQTIRRTII